MYKKTPFINPKNLEKELYLLIQKELENVLKSMQQEGNPKLEKKGTITIKISGEERYHLIKKRPNLSCKDLGEVRREIPKTSPAYDTVKKHYLQIKSKEYIQKYEEIKKKPDLSSKELQLILRYVSPKSKAYTEIQQHYQALIAKEEYEQEMEMLLAEKSKKWRKRKAFMKKCGTILGYIKIRQFSFRRNLFKNGQKTTSLPS